MKPLLLDTFSGAGGCTRGYQDAGFYVVGIDIQLQPRYIGDDFLQIDALEALRILIGGGYIVGRTGRKYYLSDFAVIHASPPCQAYSKATAWRGRREDHPDLINAVRDLLIVTNRPYVIENVEDARSRLRMPFMLCGTAFGLSFRRHRYFESPFLPFTLVPPCYHKPEDMSFDHGKKQTESEYTRAMGCNWMNVIEARQAIPPAYTRWIGERFLEILALPTCPG